MKLLRWTLLALAVGLLSLLAVTVLTVPWNHPDDEQARHDFLADFPTYSVERVAIDEQEVTAICYRIFYRAPGDKVLQEEFRQYLYEGMQWRIAYKSGSAGRH